MPSQQDSQLLREGLKRILTNIGSFKLDELLRPQLGPLSFVECNEIISGLLALFTQLDQCDFTTIPFPLLEEAKNCADRTFAVFTAIQNFDPLASAQTANTSFDAVRSWKSSLESAWTDSFRVISPILAASQGTVLATRLQESERVLRDLQEQDDQAKKITEAMRNASSKLGTGVHAAHFKDEAMRHAWQSGGWLIASAALAIYTVSYASGWQPVTWSLGAPWNITLNFSHIVIILLLTYGVVWTARMFAAARHNVVVNRHRMNALSTFETFVAGASDEQTKNAVLIQATQSIFAPQDSGFIKGEQVPYPGSQMIEILRGGAGKADSH